MTIRAYATTRRIRQKLHEHGVDAIETVHGLGYRLST